MESQIIIIGTGHVLRIHDAVFSAVVKNRPELVALELDELRLKSLLIPPEERGRDGLLSNVLAGYQEKLASINQSYVGIEFLAALEAARVLKIPVALIDRRIDITWKRLMENTTPWEKIKAMFSIAAGWFSLPYYFSRPSKLEEQVDEITGNLDEYLEELEKYLPGAKKVLVDERNLVMAENLSMLSTQYSKIVAIVGDGHVEDICRLLEDKSPAIIRLKDLREAAQKAGFTSELNITAVNKREAANTSGKKVPDDKATAENAAVKKTVGVKGKASAGKQASNGEETAGSKTYGKNKKEQDKGDLKEGKKKNENKDIELMEGKESNEYKRDKEKEEGKEEEKEDKSRNSSQENIENDFKPFKRLKYLPDIAQPVLFKEAVSKKGKEEKGEPKKERKEEKD